MSSLNTRRLLELVGLALLSDLDEARHWERDQRALKDLAQDALEKTKRLRFAEREQFRQAMQIRGANMAQFYRLDVDSIRDPKGLVTRFRFSLKPMQYHMEFADLDGAIYSIPAVREVFAEDTAARFATFIRTHMPAEIDKQLEAQL